MKVKIKYFLTICLSILLMSTAVQPVYAQNNEVIPNSESSTRALDVTLITNKVVTKSVMDGNQKINITIRYDYYKDLNGYKWIDKIQNISSTVAASHPTYTFKSYSQTDSYLEASSSSTLGKVTVHGRINWNPIGGLMNSSDIKGTVSFYPGE